MMSNAEFETLVLGQEAKTQAPRADMPAPVAGSGLPKAAPAGTRSQTSGKTGTTTNDPSQTSEKTLLTATAHAETAEKTATNANGHGKTQPLTPLPDGNTEEVDRLALFVEQMDMKSKETDDKDRYNRTVIISPLPDDVTIADVLPRIRGGVDSAYVSTFEENKLAVVTFKLPADAITYVEFCAETAIWGLWTFRMSRPGVPFEWDRRAEVQLFRSAPGIGASWDRADIPAQHPTAVAPGSRCLVYKGCGAHEVAGIYRALGLHYSQHQRDQVEAMWLDGPIRDENGEPAHGSLHIWYTSIRAAHEARVRWSPLEFEWDPCSDSPPSLMLYLEEMGGEGASIFKHHEPYENLIEVNQDTIFNRVIQGSVEPAHVYWRRENAGRPGEGASLANRLQWSLQRHSGWNGPAQPQFVAPPVSLATPYYQPASPFFYQQPSPFFPAVPPNDPFLETLPIAAGFPPRLSDDGVSSYIPGDVIYDLPIRLHHPMAPARPAVPPGHFLSPTETFVARSQERQALGHPPHTNGGGGGGQSSAALLGGAQSRALFVGGGGFDGAGSANTHTNNNNNNNQSSNLGDNNNPQSGRRAHRGHDDS